MRNRILPPPQQWLVYCITLSIGLHTTAATVTDCNEANLRSAVAGGDTVTLACDATIVLTQPLIIDRNTVVDASGHNVTLSGSNAVRMFVVSSNISLSLIGLRLSDGSAEAGGAILNDGGMLNLTNCVFAANSALGTNGIAPQAAGRAHGGAIFNRAGIVVATSCTFSNNQARGGAGAGFSGQGYCGGEAHGGAVYSDNGRVSFTNCQFTANTALGGRGGESSGCGANASGGAISSLGGVINTVSCNLSNNNVVGGDAGSGMFSASGGALGGSALGGAVSVTQAEIFLSSSGFQKNSASGGLGGRLAWGGLARGGAIHSVSTVMNLGDTFFRNNEAIAGYGNSSSIAAAGEGGAMFASGTATVARALFSTNVALGAASPTRPGSGPGGLGEAGALYNEGLIRILSSSFLFNWCQGGRGSIKEGSLPPGPPTFGAGGDGAGGALYNAGTMHILNSTLAANQSLGGVGARGGVYYGFPGIGRGGSILNAGTLQIIHATISANQAEGGAGMWSSGQCAITNSIVAFNYPSNFAGTLIDGGHNLSSDASCQFMATGSQNNINPLLGALDYYGGPTPVFILGITSPAIDGADVSASPAIDQRGVARAVGGRPDIGAMEVREAEAAALVSLGETTPQALQIRVLGHANTSYRLLSSSANLQGWTVVATSVTGANGQTLFTHSRSAEVEFYKVVTP